MAPVKRVPDFKALTELLAIIPKHPVSSSRVDSEDGGSDRIDLRMKHPFKLRLTAFDVSGPCSRHPVLRVDHVTWSEGGDIGPHLHYLGHPLSASCCGKGHFDRVGALQENSFIWSKFS